MYRRIFLNGTNVWTMAKIGSNDIRNYRKRAIRQLVAAIQCELTVVELEKWNSKVV